VTNYGCGTQKEVNQGKKRAADSLIQAQSVAPGNVPKVPDRKEAARCVPSMWVLPRTPGDRADGLAKSEGTCLQVIQL
jgi:hypothetical protein